MELNDYGYDDYGYHPDWLRRTAVASAVLYRHYFRAKTHGIEKIPEGRVLLVCNHAGQLPFDGAMLSMALLLEADPPRVARPMAEYWVSQLPFVSEVAARTGALVGTRELGQEVYIALTKADSGRGIIAGVCVAFIAIIADRMIGAWVAKRKREYGLE